MLRVGFIGWRGMVGSVLLQRMREENDFAGIEPSFSPRPMPEAPLLRSRRRAACATPRTSAISRMRRPHQLPGRRIHHGNLLPLRQSGWKGYWIDAASTLRMSDDAVIILDPVNAARISEGLARGMRAYTGGNCTVSLMVMATARALPGRPRRMDDHHDLSGRLRRRRRQNARAGGADGLPHRHARRDSVRDRPGSGSHGDREQRLPRCP